MPSHDITVDPDGCNDSGVCECCGNLSRTVWGYLSDAEGPVGVYYVSWTVGRVEHGAHFDLVVGAWGDGTSSKDRSLVSVAFRCTPLGPQFMVIDAEGRPASEPGALADTVLRREEVIGTPLAADVFAMLDAILLQDERIAELTRASE